MSAARTTRKATAGAAAYQYGVSSSPYQISIGQIDRKPT